MIWSDCLVSDDISFCERENADVTAFEKGWCIVSILGFASGKRRCFKIYYTDDTHREKYNCEVCPNHALKFFITIIML